MYYADCILVCFLYGYHVVCVCVQTCMSECTREVLFSFKMEIVYVHPCFRSPNPQKKKKKETQKENHRVATSTATRQDDLIQR